MNKLQAMEVFVQVVDAGSFTRAADQLKLPKATVSTLVHALETSLAVKLLHRTTRRVSVTVEGAAYHERCLRILADVRDAEDALAENRRRPSGRLRVDAPTGLASLVLVPALPDFLARYSELQLELGCGDRNVALVEEGVDCAVRGGALTDSTLIARRVGAMHYRTAAAPGYLERHGTPRHPDELARHRCIHYVSARTGEVVDWGFTRQDERVRITLPSQLALNDSTAYTAAGLAGLGIVQMANFLLEPLLRDGRLVALLDDWDNDPMPLHVVYPHNRHLSSKVRVFVDWVAALLADHPVLRTPARPAAGPT